MRRSDQEQDEPLLFDLPLGLPERGPAEPDASRRHAERSAREAREDRATARPEAAPEPLLPLDEPPRRPRTRTPTEEARLALAARTAPEEPAAESPSDTTGRPTVKSRLLAGTADLLVHLAVAVLALAGSRWLGVRPALSDGPAVALFLLSFSFLYAIVPLAFWGQTLGMAWAGMISRNRDGEPLTFDQTIRRWLGGLLTVTLLGLPLLLALRGRSLSDLLSGSETYSPPG